MDLEYLASRLILKVMALEFTCLLYDHRKAGVCMFNFSLSLDFVCLLFVNWSSEVPSSNSIVDEPEDFICTCNGLLFSVSWFA